MTLLADPYASGVLKKEHHERLVADLESFARDAGIQPHWIWSQLPEDMTGSQLAYLRQFRKHASEGTSGLIILGKNDKGFVEAHMSAMAGALVRNFIRARVMTLGTVIDLLAKQEMPDLTCLLIPNFFLTASETGTIAPWQVNSLFDYLTYRQVAGLQTILYATDLGLLGKEYGLAFKRHIEVHYMQAKF
ncbi:hypothetical protein [Nitratireductor sp. OM-1]|uniref:hypothetical protein n=1 Tax=Nitratireductor sp. OM-1 TaxID=1756988 RepID=UPI000DDDB7A7|nr:hypothetical protein [Nitratireductor sp. OM-1]